jgi:hypothetical protein
VGLIQILKVVWTWLKLFIDLVFFEEIAGHKKLNINWVVIFSFECKEVAKALRHL